MLGASWRTSSSGLTTILVAVGVILKQIVAGIDSDPETLVNVDAIIAAIGMIGSGLGLWNARDDKVSTTEAKLNP